MTDPSARAASDQPRSGDRSPAPGAAPDFAALLARAARRGLGAERVDGLRRLSGGASQETWSFDAWRGDPVGGLRVGEGGFVRVGELLRTVAGERCGGRWVALLEGGYDVAALPRLAEAFLLGGTGEVAPTSAQ